RRIPSRRHNSKDIRVDGRYFLGDEPCPGEIAVNGSGPVEFAPEVNEHEISRPDEAVGTGTRLVMRVPAVRANCADRRVVGHQTVLGEVLEDALLDRGF